MVKPKVIKEVAVLTQDICVRSWESIVRSKENLVLASEAIAVCNENSAGVASVWLLIKLIPPFIDLVISYQWSVISHQVKIGSMETRYFLFLSLAISSSICLNILSTHDRSFRVKSIL